MDGKYKISFSEGVQDIHMERMKMYLPKIDRKKIELHYYKPSQPLPENDTYVVDRILKHRIKNGKHQWLVRWRGYDSFQDTWEPASSFVGYLQQDWMRWNRDNHLAFPITECSS